MRVETEQFVLAVANEVESMVWSTSYDPNCLRLLQTLFDVVMVDLVHIIKTKSGWTQNKD
jgi:hypothetical protein